MDETDFVNMLTEMDSADNTNIYVEYANHILNNTIANIKDQREFLQCVKTIEECYNDLAKNKMYNKVVGSYETTDIKTFEKLTKETVKIVPKED